MKPATEMIHAAGGTDAAAAPLTVPIYETTTFEPEAPLALPITAFGARQDLSTPAELIEPWREHTSAAFTSRMFEGGHFYLFEQSKPALLEALSQVIVDCRGAQGTS